MLFISTQFLLSATFLVLASTLPSVHSTRCPSIYGETYCDSDEHCCDYDNSKCCTRPKITLSEPVLVIIALLVLIPIFFFTLIFVFIKKVYSTCCLRHSSSRGIVYGPAGSTNPGRGRLLPYRQQGRPALHPQQALRPTVVHQHLQQQQQPPLYSQQTAQDPINPCYGGPPPPSYGEVVAQDRMQDSALLLPKTP